MAAPKKPQDHLAPKSEESDVETMQFEFEGRTIIAYPDGVTGETMERLEAGHLHRFFKDLCGPEQWDGDEEKKIVGLKTYPIRKLKLMLDAWSKANESAGNS